MRVLSILAACTLVATAPQALASECPIGQTVFTDGLYGMGAGILVGGLYMLATPDTTKSRNVIPNSATAALISGGVGAAIGIAEVGICINERNSGKKSGALIPYPSIMLARKKDGSEVTGFGLSVAYFL